MDNPYAPPKDLSNNVLVRGFDPKKDTELSVEGDLIVCSDNATWPDRCVICNEKTDSQKFTRKLFWHPSWLYLLFLVSWLIYLIVALIVRKKGTIHISLCERHRNHRLVGMLLLWVGIPLSIVAIFVGGTLSSHSSDLSGIIAVVGIFGILGFLIAGLILIKTVIPRRIQDGMLWLKAGKRFTDSL
ncbi:MAG: hypothetical protein JXX29_00290 [Deltaproteobacteria bacterium]|nr:hypothetical protein [Deltaproteobacteria bacterium]MBN2670074.1 hypothetical protein [Deltaproteobacteria bacterium]